MIRTAVHYLAANSCVKLPDGSCASTGLPPVTAGHGQLIGLLQLALGIIAALSVLFVVIGGLRLVLSEGDPQSTAKARSTIIYAVVGLVVAVMAEALVTFVLGRIT